MTDPVARRIASALGETPIELSAVGGGCISRCYVARLPGGRRVFVKHHPSPPPRFFEEEARGLTEMRRAEGAPPVPEPLHVEETLLVLEYLPPGRLDPEGWAALGRALAALHRCTAPRFGFHADNYIGTTPQPNPWTDDLVTFYAEHRFGHQMRLARERGLLDAGLCRRLEALIARLGDLFPTGEPPALIHGDLWSGNVHSRSDGVGCLVDPAAHYGLREADLAMTRMFGRLPDAFYRGYEEVWPLPPEAERRVDLLNLYHQLNHLNLFGDGYLAGVHSILRSYT